MKTKKLLLSTGIGLTALSLILIGLSFFPGWTQLNNPAIIFLSLTAIFVFFQLTSPSEWTWKGWLYIPTSVFMAFGIVFMLNVLTNDWNAWAYAWMFCLAGLGVGVALAARTTGQIHLLYQIGLWTAAASLVLFSVFGAIVSGPFMLAFSLIGLGLVGVLFILWATKRIDFSVVNWPYPQEPQTPQNEGSSPTNQNLAEPLSKRELEVLQWIEQGLSNAEIAARLVVAPSTVKTHINNIYTKLGAGSRTQALRRAKELKLL